MAISDMINNNSFNGQYLLGDQQYNPTQSDVLGRLRSPTPTNAGLPNVDPQNDDRNSFDFKQQQKQANIDTLEAHDSPDAIKGKDGFIYNTVPDTRKDQLITGLIAYGTSFLAGENTGQSLQRAGEAVNSHIATIKRQNLIPQLEAKGYQPVDIQRYVETGNTTDLLTNKGKYVPVDGGYINNLTSDFVQTQTGTAGQLPQGMQVGINQTPNGPITVEQGANGKFTSRPSTKTEIEASQLAPTATGGEDGSESLNAQAGGYVGFRVGTNQKPIETGQTDPQGNKLYFGKDGVSVVDAHGMKYTDPTTNATQQKQQQADQKASEAATGQLALVDQSIATLNQLTSAPGFNRIYGNIQGRLPDLSEDASDAAALRDQLAGQTFLQARQYLKGQGAITDHESDKAEAALTLLSNPTISDSMAKKAAADYMEVLNTGKARLQKMQQKGQPAQAQAPTATTPATPTGVKDHSNLW
ncbi:hypothetical protein K0N88_001197 [Salmonella enterica]|nr:hypothetical protein [Salmonella enterica]